MEESLEQSLKGGGKELTRVLKKKKKKKALKE
jgi:hypothetical protein